MNDFIQKSSSEIRTENGFTPEYEMELRAELKAMERGEGKTFSSVDELIADLNS